MNTQDTENSLIELADSHVTQHTNGHIKSPWKVFTAGSDKTLQEFPNTFTDAQMFSIMDFAKEYELKALNAGIKFQRDKQNQVLTEVIENQRNLIEQLGIDNDRLAAALEREMFKNVVEE